MARIGIAQRATLNPMLKCIRCGVEFARRGSRGPIPQWCAACAVIEGNAYRAAWTKANRSRRNDTHRAWRARNPDRDRAYHNRHRLKRDFNLSEAEFDALSDKQNGCCAICGHVETNPKKKGAGARRLSVDHNHQTGMIRGLLCSACNQGLGLLKDSLQVLVSATGYLRQSLDYDFDGHA